MRAPEADFSAPHCCCENTPIFIRIHPLKQAGSGATKDY